MRPLCLIAVDVGHLGQVRSAGERVQLGFQTQPALPHIRFVMRPQADVMSGQLRVHAGRFGGEGLAISAHHQRVHQALGERWPVRFQFGQTQFRILIFIQLGHEGEFEGIKNQFQVQIFRRDREPHITDGQGVRQEGTAGQQDCDKQTAQHKG